MRLNLIKEGEQLNSPSNLVHEETSRARRGSTQNRGCELVYKNRQQVDYISAVYNDGATTYLYIRTSTNPLSVTRCFPCRQVTRIATYIVYKGTSKIGWIVDCGVVSTYISKCLSTST